jgi:hypothetical protein
VRDVPVTAQNEFAAAAGERFQTGQEAVHEGEFGGLSFFAG